MSILYIWEVTSMSTIDASPSEPNFVVQANYTVTGVEVVDTKTYTSKIANTAYFTLNPDQPSYISYADLTNEIVTGWIKEQLGVDAVANYEKSLAGQLNQQINPPVSPEPTPLPWS